MHQIQHPGVGQIISEMRTAGGSDNYRNTPGQMITEKAGQTITEILGQIISEIVGQTISEIVGQIGPKYSGLETAICKTSGEPYGMRGKNGLDYSC